MKYSAMKEPAFVILRKNVSCTSKRLEHIVVPPMCSRGSSGSVSAVWRHV